MMSTFLRLCSAFPFPLDWPGDSVALGEGGGFGKCEFTVEALAKFPVLIPPHPPPSLS
jgi:hypothetical protein